MVGRSIGLAYCGLKLAERTGILVIVLVAITIEEQLLKRIDLRLAWFYREGLEAEFSIAPADWASAPLDAGTEQVARDGFVVIMDRDDHATAVAAAVCPARPLAADGALRPR